MRRTLLVATLLLGGVASANPAQSGRVPVYDTSFVADASGRAQSRTIYLNKNGVTLMPGQNDSRANKSSIISAQAQIPAWNASSTLWTQTVSCLREMFAPFDLEITETDPGTKPHIEAVFGGRPSNLGMTGSMAGVSPFSTQCKVIENSVVFTFTEVIPQNAQIACEIMAQEIAHSYGLDHELLASDPMTYLPFAGRRTFQNVTAACGESGARPCGVQGMPMCRENQNSYALLLERIGAAGTGDIDPPTVAITSPMNGAVVTPGFVVSAAIADDVLVKFARASIDGVDLTAINMTPWTFATPDDLAPGKHVIEVVASDGAHEVTQMIEVTVPGAPADEVDGDSPVGGCSTGGGTSWLFGLLLVGLVAIQRRAQR